MYLQLAGILMHSALHAEHKTTPNLFRDNHELGLTYKVQKHLWIHAEQKPL